MEDVTKIKQQKKQKQNAGLSILEQWATWSLPLPRSIHSKPQKRKYIHSELANHRLTKFNCWEKDFPCVIYFATEDNKMAATSGIISAQPILQICFLEHWRRLFRMKTLDHIPILLTWKFFDFFAKKCQFRWKKDIFKK